MTGPALEYAPCAPAAGPPPRAAWTVNAAIVLLGLFAALTVPAAADALPFFSRQVGRNCTYCHTLVPKLNETGRTFRSNGYRFEAEGEWKDVREAAAPPVSMEIEVEALADRTSSGGATTRGNDLKIEEAELVGGGVMDRSGLVSALAALAVAEADGPAGSTTYETTLRQAFVRLNDLAGRPGAGLLNLKAGRDAVSLPFVGSAQRFIFNPYLAEGALGLLSDSDGVAELTGISSGEETAHRYAFGISRQTVDSSDKLSGLHAWYAASYAERFSAGAIFRKGRYRVGPNEDADKTAYGIAVEGGSETALFTLGAFTSDAEGGASLKNYMAEALWTPSNRHALGARYDAAARSGRGDAVARSLMARYTMAPNAYAQFEYRDLSDPGRITGANDSETKLRLFLTVVF